VLLRQPFYGPLIIKTFAFFFKWTKKHDHNWVEIADKPPLGALGLATTAVSPFIAIAQMCPTNMYYQVERALMYWKGLPEDAADQLAIKPYTKYTKRKSKARKVEPTNETTAPVDAPLNPATPNAPPKDITKINEFSFEKWRANTNQWIVGAVDQGFDSMAVMQPLMTKANFVHAGDGSLSQGNQPALDLSSSSSFRQHIPMEASDTE
jgi:hypothetical protein